VGVRGKMGGKGCGGEGGEGRLRVEVNHWSYIRHYDKRSKVYT